MGRYQLVLLLLLCQAVWAGWGHASENHKLPELLQKNGIAFLGKISPPSQWDQAGVGMHAHSAGPRHRAMPVLCVWHVHPAVQQPPGWFPGLFLGILLFSGFSL